MSPTLYEHVIRYAKQGVYPFHMPGHKRNPAFLPEALITLDVTEFGDMDNLHAPNGIIREMQHRIACFYGAEESFLLVNGSSSGVVAAICTACADGETLTMARNCHVSAYHGMALAGAQPVYIIPSYASDGLTGGPESEQFDGVTGAVLITSPTYEGFVPDVAGIAERVHARGGLLIVDEAHGAHFPFHNLFPRSALAAGADIVINSFHKTLPALSQSAVLHVRGSCVDRERLRYFLRAMQTTSPSYLVMASTDYMLRMLWEQPEWFKKYTAQLQRLRAALPVENDRLPVCLTGASRIGAYGVTETDAGKLLFAVRSSVSGPEIERMLAEQYGVQLEVAYERHLLAMTSVADTEDGFERLAKAVETLNRTLPYGEQADVRPLPPPDVVLPPREAVRRRTETLDWKHAVGGIAGAFITPYPPGVPLLAPGERITDAIRTVAVQRGLAHSGVKVIV